MPETGLTLETLTRMLTGLAVLTLALIQLLLWLSFRRPLMARWAAVFGLVGVLDILQTLVQVSSIGVWGRVAGLATIVLMFVFMVQLGCAIAESSGVRATFERPLMGAGAVAAVVVGAALLATEPTTLASPGMWYLAVAHPAMLALVMLLIAANAAHAIRVVARHEHSLGLWLVVAGLALAMVRPPVLALLRDVGVPAGVSGLQVLLAFTVVADMLLVGVGSVLIVLEKERASAIAQATRAERAERIERLGLMAGSIAHDMNNVLASVMGGVSLAREPGATPAQVREELSAVEVALEHGRAMTQRLLSFAAGAPRSSVPVELTAWLAGAEASLRFALGAPHELRLATIEGALPVRVDPTRLRQALLNTLLNSRDAAAGRAVRIEVSLRRHTVRRPRPLGVFTLPVGEWVELRIQDDGPGFAAGALDKVFEPFFTTKGAAGTGLGLATVFAVMRDAGGGVQASNAPTGGAVIECWLPVHAEND